MATGDGAENLLQTRYASAEKVILVCDNLNTHTKGAFYEAFEPAKARALVKRLEFCHTPKHGSWLNIAENELSSMTRQCVAGRRFATIKELSKETTPWHEHSNARQRSVDWQFKIDDARVKLKSIYPKLEV
jgi:DDE superfamily endonuclease